MYDLIIVGAGIAGMSAAIYGLRAGRSVLLLEEKGYGGQMVNALEVENYPGIPRISGYELSENLYQQVSALKGEIKYEKVLKIQEDGKKKKVVTNRAEYLCNCVILATGAKNRPLGIDREKELTGAGVSYCATCDGAFFRGKDVAVVGGGNTALEDVNFLSNYCRMVYLIHRRDTFRGEERLVHNLQTKKNVAFILESEVVALIGKEHVEAVKVVHRQTGEERILSVAALFVAIGQMPDNTAFENVVEVDKTGYIIAGEDCKTKTRGIYTAGDCRTKTVRQLATAAADGAVAALAAAAELSERSLKS